MAKKLPITYNRKLQLGAVYYDPLMFIVHHKLFDDFLFLTDRKLDWLDELGVKSASLNIPRTVKSAKLEQTQRFEAYAKTDPKRKFVLYSPLDPPYKVNPLTYLMNSPTIAHAYENKRYFRDEFADLIRMPEYEIKYVNELDRAAAYRDLKEEYGQFVMQDEESSGSKGTFIVKNEDDYVDAVKALKKLSYSRSIIVSKYIKGQAASIQVCITKYGIFSGGVQKQLLDSQYLCDPKIEGGTKWCGGELGVEYPDIVQHQASEMATIVGSELASHGYKGIFGIDLIITPENEVYAIEINARHTGYSFLISDMQLLQGKIPFMLLHILELGNFEYEVTDLDALPSITRYKRPVSYMIVNNSTDQPFVIKKHIKPGLYKIQGDKLIYEKSAYSIADLKSDDDVLIFSRFNEGDTAESGKRILKIIKRGKSMAKNDLNTKSQAVVEIVKKHFEIPG